MPTRSLFAILAGASNIIASPIDIQQSPFDMTMKRRVRPVLHLPNQSVFDRIVVHVVDMPLQDVDWGGDDIGSTGQYGE